MLDKSTFYWTILKSACEKCSHIWCAISLILFTTATSVILFMYSGNETDPPSETLLLRYCICESKDLRAEQWNSVAQLPSKIRSILRSVMPPAGKQKGFVVYSCFYLFLHTRYFDAVFRSQFCDRIITWIKLTW